MAKVEKWMLQPMALVFGPFEEKVIDRSAVVAIGRDPAQFKWARIATTRG